MVRTFKFVAAATALAVPASALAQSAARPACMTEAEASALFSYSLPEVIDTVTDKCSPALPSTSFLATRGSALVASYRTETAASWPLAKAAFLKTAGEDDAEAAEIVAAMPDEALKGLVGAALTVVVGKDIKAADCPRIDSIVAALAPLPVSNVSALLVNMMSLTGSGKDEKFRICPS